MTAPRAGWGFECEELPLRRSIAASERERGDLLTTIHGFDEFFRYAYCLPARHEPGAEAPITDPPAAPVRNARASAAFRKE